LLEKIDNAGGHPSIQSPEDEQLVILINCQGGRRKSVRIKPVDKARSGIDDCDARRVAAISDDESPIMKQDDRGVVDAFLRLSLQRIQPFSISEVIHGRAAG